MKAPGTRWLRFSLRSMFVVLTVCAIFLGTRIRWIQQRREALRHVARSYVAGETSLAPREQRAPWSLRMLGERPVVQIEFSAGNGHRSSLEH